MSDPVAETPAVPTQQQIDALIVKHRAEIDRVKIMDSAGQMEEFRKAGVEPRAIMEFYKEQREADDELKRMDDLATRKTNILGIAAAVAGAGLIFALGEKFSPSFIVRLFAVPLAGVAAGLGGTYAGSRLFAGRIRDESRQLNIDAKNALERELAIALENKAHEGAAQAQAAEATPARNITPRDPAFAAQAAAEKAANAAQSRGA